MPPHLELWGSSRRPDRCNKLAYLRVIFRAVGLDTARHVDAPGLDRGDGPGDIGWRKAAGEPDGEGGADGCRDLPVEGDAATPEHRAAAGRRPCLFLLSVE